MCWNIRRLLACFFAWVTGPVHTDDWKPAAACTHMHLGNVQHCMLKLLGMAHVYMCIKVYMLYFLVVQLQACVCACVCARARSARTHLPTYLSTYIIHSVAALVINGILAQLISDFDSGCEEVCQFICGCQAAVVNGCISISCIFAPGIIDLLVDSYAELK